MSQSLKVLLFFTICMGTFFAACKDPEKKNDGSDAILNQPPYAVYTDSLRQAGMASPNTAALYLERGDLLAQNNLHEIAVKDFKKAWELQPGAPAGLRYASTLSIIGRTDEAVKLLQDCLRRFPDNRNFSGLLGTIYLQSGKTAQALVLYNKLLEADPSNFEAWYEKGLLLQKTRDTAGALEALQKAYSLQPVNTYALELAHLYAENRDSKALALCDQVLAKDSSRELVDPLFIKGIYYSNTGQYARAIVQFDSCTHREYKFTDAWLEKGIAQFHQKDYEGALATFKMTTTISNTYPDGYFWMARCYEITGKKEEALMYYQEALALDKDFTEAKEAIKRLRA